jgi:hypothetical protein
LAEDSNAAHRRPQVARLPLSAVPGLYRHPAHTWEDWTNQTAQVSSFLYAPDRAAVAADLVRVRAVIDRIAADVDELARSRRVEDPAAAVFSDRRAERCWRRVEPDLEFRAFCVWRRLPASSSPQLERAWDAWQAERYRRGEISQRPGYTDNAVRPR